MAKLKGQRDEKEETKLKAQQAAGEAAQRRSKNKKGSSAAKTYIAVGAAVAATIFGVFLAMTPDPQAARQTPQDRKLVNDPYKIKGLTSLTENFTAAASPFFNKWTHGDVTSSLGGIALSYMIGMPGALQYCEEDKSTEGGAIPTAYDAREAWPNCHWKVRDSGNCSGSYAIAAASSLSSRFCIADNSKHAALQLSAQQVLSCDKKSRGCQGGGVDNVWAYIQRRGLYTEECVPYAGGVGAPCKTECAESAKLKALDHCVLNGVKAMKREIYNRGPVVAPAYMHDEYLVYSGGVFAPTEDARLHYASHGGNKSKAMLHAVAVVGWGKAMGTSYWIVENSWGEGWGENGYARVAMGSVLMEHYVIAATPATEAALAEAKQKEESAAERLEEAKLERAAREERIKENKRQRDEEQAAAQEAADLEDMDDDFDVNLDEAPDEVDLDDSM